jgi:hypothetical protein
MPWQGHAAHLSTHPAKLFKGYAPAARPSLRRSLGCNSSGILRPAAKRLRSSDGSQCCPLALLPVATTGLCGDFFISAQQSDLGGFADAHWTEATLLS